MKNNYVGLYIHIPFCQSKCPYCDFYSVIEKNNLNKKKYLSALKKEIKIYSNKLPGIKIKSIYIGGGTPTILDGQQIYELISLCYKYFHISKTVEITVESNPSTFDEKKCRLLHLAGVNRISIGAQSMDNRILKKIGRIHDKQDIINSYFTSRSAGFNNINLDIMFGLPGQTMACYMKTLEEVINLAPEHISLYALSIEKGTLFEELYKNHKIKLLSDDTVYKMYKKTIEILTYYKYKHYEISNFSLPGKQCIHNCIYWKNQPYLGLGASAVSYIDNRRFQNSSNIEEYTFLLSNDILPIKSKEVLSLKEKMAETVILQLRMIKGLSKNDFKNVFNVSVEDIFYEQLFRLKELKLLNENDTHYFLTDKGIPLANNVFIEFLD